MWINSCTIPPMCAKADLDKMQGHTAEKPVQNMVMVVPAAAGPVVNVGETEV